MKLSVTIKPNSRKGPLVEAGHDGSLTVYVREPAVDGKANAALVKVVAEHLGLPKTRVKLVRGSTSKSKTLEVSE
jgi:uncharacterized protein (TIGR00251 family)